MVVQPALAGKSRAGLDYGCDGVRVGDAPQGTSPFCTFILFLPFPPFLLYIYFLPPCLFILTSFYVGHVGMCVVYVLVRVL